MKFDSFYSDEMYELTERNILSVFKAVVDKDKTRMYGINLINEKYKGPGMEEVPCMYINTHKSVAFSGKIRYMFGQLKVVHDKRKVFSPSEGFLNYKGEKWTNIKTVLYVLCFISISCLAMHSFEFHDGKLYAEIDRSTVPTFWPPKSDS